MIEDDIQEGRWYRNKRSGQRWEANWVDWSEGEVVMVSNIGRTRRITFESLLNNWEIA